MNELRGQHARYGHIIRFTELRAAGRFARQLLHCLRIEQSRVFHRVFTQHLGDVGRGHIGVEKTTLNGRAVRALGALPDFGRQQFFPELAQKLPQCPPLKRRRIRSFGASL